MSGPASYHPPHSSGTSTSPPGSRYVPLWEPSPSADAPTQLCRTVMPQCFCDLCTGAGRHMEGAPQRRTAYADHMKAQQTRDLFCGRHDTVSSERLEGAASLAAFSDRTPTCHPPFNITPFQHPSHTAPAAPISDDLTTSMLLQPARLAAIKTHIAAYRLPQALSFSFPPLAPTSMFPGPCGYSQWDQGPVGLRCDVQGNAATLLHVSFLQAHYEDTRELLSGATGNLPDSISSLDHILRTEIARMEQFRRSEWTRQQYLPRRAKAAEQPPSQPFYCNTGNLAISFVLDTND